MCYNWFSIDIHTCNASAHRLWSGFRMLLSLSLSFSLSLSLSLSPSLFPVLVTVQTHSHACSVSLFRKLPNLNAPRSLKSFRPARTKDEPFCLHHQHFLFFLSCICCSQFVPFLFYPPGMYVFILPFPHFIIASLVGSVALVAQLKVTWERQKVRERDRKREKERDDIRRRQEVRYVD